MPLPRTRRSPRPVSRPSPRSTRRSRTTKGNATARCEASSRPCSTPPTSPPSPPLRCRSAVAAPVGTADWPEKLSHPLVILGGMIVGLVAGLLVGLVVALVVLLRRPAAVDPNEVVASLIAAERARATEELDGKKMLIDQQLGAMTSEHGKV